MSKQNKVVKSISELTGKELNKVTEDFNNILQTHIFPELINAFDKYKEGKIKDVPVYSRLVLKEVVAKFNSSSKTTFLLTNL